ncbi:NADH-binding oxidoreductase [Escherichia coli]|uniref:Gfo/Idh/MocA family oxidoreductase n=1 Tax=Escherichia coli TaxID=562 RepID=UPI0010D97BC5|nr:Gfo/Idh/MocA family oxidoreductase [Escherichia coli]GCM40822.1 NADH-binding oxidoreductase [Escherichia coli]
MKKLVATAPRVAALVEYEDRAILANEVKIRVRFGAPKHGTEVVDFRAASPFIDEDFNGEWQMFVTTARALRRCGVPGWGVFTNKELQGGGPLIDIGIHMLDAAMYVLGFPAVKSVNAHSFQKIGTQKSCGQFGEWDPATYSVEDSLFGTIEFHNGGILWLETSFALNIREQSIMNVSFCGDKAGATLFPAHIYTDNNGELMTLMQRELADDNRHLRSMEAFINHVQGKPVMIADAEQGYIIQQLVAALYQSAETGTRVEL